MNATQDQITQLETHIAEIAQRIATLRKQAEPTPVQNYTFNTLNGRATLLELFGEREVLFAIHNMGQGCRYCTLWADGLNPFVPHLEDRFALVLLSKDPPEVQRRFANSRGWRFRMASHGGDHYIGEQAVVPGQANAPGVVVYERRETQVFRRSAAGFGPGDLYCSLWHLLGLAGIGESDWSPQFRYWQPPKQLDDGGADRRD